MKLFTFATALLSVSILVVLMIFQASAASTSTMKDPVQNAPVPVTGAERKVAPVFDASGVVVSNPSGIVLNSASSGVRKIAPVFDATGAVISDPSGAILYAVPSSKALIPATGTEWTVAPVFDATGAVVSDPSGILLNKANP